jgi:hypothetical protein
MGPTTCTFGNTTLSRGFDFTFGPGVQPSVCMLYTVPHTTGLPNVGELRFQTAGEPPFVFRDCLVEDPRLISTEQGQFWQLPVKDRRWKWQFGFINGSYNVPLPFQGTYLRPRTPQQLASALLVSMDETGFDVSRLPNVSRPHVEWYDTLPAAELDQLCASLGCIVVLNPITDKVEIWPEGDGNVLPSGPRRGASYAPVYPAQPHTIVINAAPTQYQMHFDTEAVGMDTDHNWVPINSLSYKPVNGWGQSDVIGGFPQFTDAEQYVYRGQTLKIRDLARATVFRSYRVTGNTVTNSWVVPDLILPAHLQPQNRGDIQFMTTLADEELVAASNTIEKKQAVVYAKYYTLKKPFPKPELIRYSDGFSFDTTTGVVHFNEPLFLFVGGVYAPAQVRYETAFIAARDGKPYRMFEFYPTGSPIVTPWLSVTRKDLTKKVIYRDPLGGFVETNAAEIQQELEHCRDTILATYGLQNGGTVNYQKLIPISPDGLTQQITWSGGGQRPPRTVASQAQRHNRYIASPKELRERRNDQLLIAAQQSAIRAITTGVAGVL